MTCCQSNVLTVVEFPLCSAFSASPEGERHWTSKVAPAAHQYRLMELLKGPILRLNGSRYPLNHNDRPMDDTGKNNVKTGQQESKKPWEPRCIQIINRVKAIHPRAPADRKITKRRHSSALGQAPRNSRYGRLSSIRPQRLH